MNIEGMYSVYFKKTERSLRLAGVVAPTPRPPAHRASDLRPGGRAKPSFEILRFDIRYSAVRCLILIIEAANQIIKKPCHSGVVSYEGRFLNAVSYRYLFERNFSPSQPPAIPALRTVARFHTPFRLLCNPGAGMKSVPAADISCVLFLESQGL